MIHRAGDPLFVNFKEMGQIYQLKTKIEEKEGQLADLTERVKSIEQKIKDLEQELEKERVQKT